MSPRSPIRTEKHEQAQQSATEKLSTKEATDPKAPVRDVGGRVRQANTENA